MALGKAVSRWAVGMALMVVAAAPAVASSVYAASNATNGNGNPLANPSHAFWLPPDVDDTTPGRYYQWVELSNPTLTFTDTFGNIVAWDNSGAENAILAGQIQQATSPSTTGPNAPVPGGAVFDVIMHFTNGQTHAEWTSLTNGGTVKVENDSHANVPDWRFFELDTTQSNQLTEVGNPSNIIPLGLFSPEGENFGLQVGVGASMKYPSDVLGASTWLDINPGVDDPWEGRYPHGDINIQLTVVPTPSAAIGGMAMLGLLSVRRRRRT